MTTELPPGEIGANIRGDDEQHHRGRQHADYVNTGNPAQELSLFTIRADPDIEPGTIVTLYHHDGALGMPYISTRP